MVNVLTWLKQIKDRIVMDSRPIKFNKSKEWVFGKNMSELAHKTGRYFKIKGIRYGSIDLPMIDQPEKGILGFILREHEGKRQVLFQAKAEPGNIGKIQLAPSVQATISNYKRVHGGKEQPFIENFINEEKKVLHNTLQTEQGWRFLWKQNRNIVIEADVDAADSEYHYWADLDDVYDLSMIDNLLNSDSRSVLSCLFLDGVDSPKVNNEYSEALQASLNTSHYKPEVLKKWVYDHIDSQDMEIKEIPLSELRDWVINPDKITHIGKKFFDVLHIAIDTNCREVEKWDQPIVSTHSTEEGTLIGKIEDGCLHVLTHIEYEPGLVKKAGITSSYFAARDGLDDENPDITKWLKENRKNTILKKEIDNSEEGGRFYFDSNKHTITILKNPTKDLELSNDYLWLTLQDLRIFRDEEGLLTNELRSVLCLLFGLFQKGF